MAPGIMSRWGARWGSRWGDRWGSVGETPVAAVVLLGGKASFPYELPYDKLKREKEKKRLEEVKEAIESAERERAEIEAKLQAETTVKASQVKKLEKQFKLLQIELQQLYTTLQNLEALRKQRDEDDAIVALLMSNPFL
jgi:septal ring factor EnvC (AmiA/AmiB activator)